MNLQEKVLRRLLQEAEATKRGTIAATIDPTREEKQITLYYPADLLRIIRSNKQLIQKSSNFADAYVIFKEAICGAVAVKKIKNWSGPCNNSWEIAFSVGPGFGKEVYGAAYAYVKKHGSGQLTSDRQHVSALAQDAWMKAFKSARPRHEFDDLTAPADQKKTPDDPTDDCVLHTDDSGKSLIQLNHSYEVLPEDISRLDDQLKRHDIFKRILEKSVSIPGLYIEKILSFCGKKYFFDHFKPSDD